LGFDRVAQRFLEAACRFTRGDCRLSIEFLSCTCGLIRKAFSLRSRIAGDLAESLLDLTAKIASGTFYTVFIHSRFLRLAVKPPQSTMVPLLCDRWQSRHRTNPAAGLAVPALKDGSLPRLRLSGRARRRQGHRLIARGLGTVLWRLNADGEMREAA
jgi:hypothetical protein